MIYRRPIRDVVEERHGRTCGVHVFTFYTVALSAVLAMSTACLTASDTGFFTFEQAVNVPSTVRDQDAPTEITVDYEITYGWKSMCSKALATYEYADGLEESEPGSGCFGLSETSDLGSNGVLLAAGRSMTADTGLAVALGHAAAAAVAAAHILFFGLLYFNIDPAPVKGYLYMRGLGLMSALASFYLLFTCIVTFFLAIKGSLDLRLSTSAGLRPSWAYVLTVIDVTTMVVVGMLACQDEEVDTAIATPQYTSSSKNEDTVKRASGKLLHLRSRSSDMVGETCMSLSDPVTGSSSTAPKVTVVGGATGSSGLGIQGGNGAGAVVHPTASVAAAATVGANGGAALLQGEASTGNTLRMSASAPPGPAHPPASAAFGGLVGRSSPVGSIGSGSVLSSWTDRVSALSPRRTSRLGDEEEGGEEFDGHLGGGGGGGDGGASRSKPKSSGSVLDAALLTGATGVDGGEEDLEQGGASVVDVSRGGSGGGNGLGGSGSTSGAGIGSSVPGETRYAQGGSKRVGVAGERSGHAIGNGGSVGNDSTAAAAAASDAPSATRPAPRAHLGPPRAMAASEARGPHTVVPDQQVPQAGPTRIPQQVLANFSTARTTFSVGFEDADNEHSEDRAAGAGTNAHTGSSRRH